MPEQQSIKETLDVIRRALEDDKSVDHKEDLLVLKSLIISLNSLI